MGCAMFDTAKEIIKYSILSKQPDIPRKELRKEIFLRMYGLDFTDEEIKKILMHIAREGEKPQRQKNALLEG
jgi:hypothetical protein